MRFTFWTGSVQSVQQTKHWKIMMKKERRPTSWPPFTQRANICEIRKKKKNKLRTRDKCENEKFVMAHKNSNTQRDSEKCTNTSFSLFLFVVVIIIIFWNGFSSSFCLFYSELMCCSRIYSSHHLFSNFIYSVWFFGVLFCCFGRNLKYGTWHSIQQI